MEKINEIEIVCSNRLDVVDDWVKLDPKIYYKDGEPYGMIATIYDDSFDGYVILSSVASPELPFTRGMIRDIITLSKTNRICLATDDENYQAQIASVLMKHGKFKFRYINCVMLSYNYKE